MQTKATCDEIFPVHSIETNSTNITFTEEEKRWRSRANRAAACWIVLCVLGLVSAIMYFRRRLVSTEQPRGAPDYSKDASWASLPSKRDGADIIPAWCGEDKQELASVDVFYIHPTAWLLGSTDNSPLDDPFTNFIVDSQLSVQASVFNGVAKIYAPRYRCASLAVQGLNETFNWAPGGGRTGRALRLAYGDVEAAFDTFLKRYAHNTRPFIIAGHSQGTMMAKRLLSRIPALYGNELLDRLVVAYLIGNTVEEAELPIPLCDRPNVTRCFLAWNTVIQNGTISFACVQLFTLLPSCAFHLSLFLSKFRC